MKTKWDDTRCLKLIGENDPFFQQDVDAAREILRLRAENRALLEHARLLAEWAVCTSGSDEVCIDKEYEDNCCVPCEVVHDFLTAFPEDNTEVKP